MFRILYVDFKTIFLTVTLYYVRGLFVIIRTFSLMYQIMLEGCIFSRDVSYNNYLSWLFPFLFTFHILTHNFYKNCTCMSTIMHIVISNGYFCTNKFCTVISSEDFYNYIEFGLLNEAFTMILGLIKKKCSVLVSLKNSIHSVEFLKKICYCKMVDILSFSSLFAT